MRVDDAYLSDGADIHDIAGLIGIYRSLAEVNGDATDLERELRSFVVNKRLAKLSPK
jgi:hypothetical protein